MSEFISLGPKHPFIYGNSGFDMVTDIQGEIRQNLRNILLTNPGEWPGDINLGAGITQLVFETKTNNVLREIDMRVRSQIERYLPIITLESLDYNRNLDNKNLVTFSLVYSISAMDITDTLNLLLDN
jgi:phage baseplate assembly protein W